MDRRFSGQDGYRVGTEFRIASVGINLEYKEARYDDVTIDGSVALGSADLYGSAREIIGKRFISKFFLISRHRNISLPRIFFEVETLTGSGIKISC